MSAQPTDQHFALITSKWKLIAPLQFHRRVENFIYFSQVAECEAVVRITEPSRRSYEELASELDWQIWMSQHSVPCAEPLLSNSGQLVELIECEGQRYFVSVFKRMKGEALRKPQDFTPSVLHEWGRTLAVFHNATMNYVPSENITSRLHWREDFERSLAVEIRSETDTLAALKFREVKRWLGTLPQAREDYGLVHTDLHNGNFLVDHGRLQVFDFDDCCYHWFMYDLAVPLFYMRFNNDDQQMQLDMRAIETSYLDGYQSLRPLNSELRQRIEGFVRLRTLIMYGWCRAHLKRQVLGPAVLEWCEKYIKWCEESLKHPVELA